MSKLKLEGSSTGAVKAIRDLNKEINKSEKGLQLSTKEAAKMERSAKRGEAFTWQVRAWLWEIGAAANFACGLAAYGLVLTQ